MNGVVFFNDNIVTVLFYSIMSDNSSKKRYEDYPFPWFVKHYAKSPGTIVRYL